ncbi:hypothetical protein THIOKS11470004 [Thiocapsa sp. KS1]|nr:hypothetical protein THIOKS11470004 [Thiocapsa sp. KS1]
MVTVVFQVTNRMGGAADLEGRLLMPQAGAPSPPNSPLRSRPAARSCGWSASSCPRARRRASIA